MLTHFICLIFSESQNLTMAPRNKKEEAAVNTETKSGRVSRAPKNYVQKCVMNFAKVAKSKNKKKKLKQKQEQNKRYKEKKKSMGEC